MGFFNSCWETLLTILAYAETLGLNRDQQPLHLPGHEHASAGHDVDATGVSFKVQGTNFTCKYPSMTGYVPCNSASDRQCWLKSTTKRKPDFTITTDYENHGPQGIVREYFREVDLKAIAPDGYVKELGQVFDGQYPGPPIEACWGDQLVVHVTNKIPNLGTTVHWHGIRQLHTNQQDGVNGVTQCPIAPNQTFTYVFNVTQYGHTWYHSHYQTQYSDGVMGGLTIYGPSSADWDETDEPILINDWVHENTSVAFRQELTGGIPIADSLLLGGQGKYQCRDNDPLCCSGCNGRQQKCVNDPEFCCVPSPFCFANGVQLEGSTFSKTFTENKRYLLKLVGSSAEAMFIFSIDEHELEVIQTDLVPIHPYTTDSLFIGIGQRYQVIVTAKPNKKSTDGNYWIRTRIADGCGTVAQDDERMGIIRYNHSSTTTPSTHKQHHRTACEDEPMDKLRPIVSWGNISDFQGDMEKYTFDADISVGVFHRAQRWDLTDRPLYIDYSNPTILNTKNNTFLNTADYAIVDYPYNEGYVYLVIDGENLNNAKRNITAAHPIHLHGHDFVILAQEDSSFNGTLPPFKYFNPPRRDVALLYSGGYLALAFKPDNPGIWLVHCHIAWHASSGLALQVLERQSEIVSTIGSLSSVQNNCQRWDAVASEIVNNATRDDSGV